MERRTSKWIIPVVITVLVPVLYLLSFIPLVLVFGRNQPSNKWIERGLMTYVAPVAYAREHGPDWMVKGIRVSPTS